MKDIHIICVFSGTLAQLYFFFFYDVCTKSLYIDGSGYVLTSVIDALAVIKARKRTPEHEKLMDIHNVARTKKGFFT